MPFNHCLTVSSSEHQSLPDRQTGSSSPLQTDRKCTVLLGTKIQISRGHANKVFVLSGFP